MPWKLQNIRGKVRDLTGSPSTNQISDSDLNEYIENFYQQDLASILNLEEMDDYHRLRTFENLDRYGNLPSNFSIKGPAWVNGREVPIYHDESCFYAEYPQNYQTRESIGTGDGSTTAFSGTLDESPVSQTNLIIDDDNEVFSPRLLEIDALTAAANAAVTTKKAHLLSTGDRVLIGKIQSGMTQINGAVSKITVTSGTAFTLDGIDSTNYTAYESGGEVIPISKIPLEGSNGGTGTVTTATGAWSVTFNAAPADGQDIRANYEVYSTGEPDAILVDDRELIIRPVPSGTYDLKIGISKAPGNLRDADDNFDDNATLLRDDWGKLVAYGAAIDLLNDRNQQEVAAQLEPQFQRLMAQVQNRWVRNYHQERAVPTF